MQATVVEWAWLQAPSLIALATLFAVPNGARTAISVAGRLKREGMRAGIPDLVLPVPAGGYAGLLVEMKTATGATSADQRAWHKALEALGHKVVISRSIDHACQVLREYALSWEQEATFVARAALHDLWAQFRGQKKGRPVVAGRQVSLAGRVKQS